MLSNSYYKDLISKLKDRVPRGNNLAHLLIDILCLSKESVYRRLRGEVPFTFDEIAILARQFDISIDEIINRRKALDSIDEERDDAKSQAESYMNILTHLETMLRTIRNDMSAEYNYASNTIPPLLFPHHENLLKFRLSRQVAYETNTNMAKDLQQVDISEKIIEVHRKLCNHIKKMPCINFILDNNAFASLVNEIKYCRDLKMITEIDVVNIHSELHNLVNEMDAVASSGHFNTGGSVSIYISNINFEASYISLDKKGAHTCIHKVSSIGSSYNDQSNQIQKNWILSLKRHSTLISRSGEVERVKYFNRQRDLIDTLCEKSGPI